MGLSEGHANLESLTQPLVKGHRASRDKTALACPCVWCIFMAR